MKQKSLRYAHIERRYMRCRTAVLVLVLFFGLSTFVRAQETVNSGDLLDKLTFALDLDFKQQDTIKPAIQAYVAAFEQILKDENNEKPDQTQIKILNQRLEQQIILILSPDQMNTWKTAKREIMPYAQAEERERHEKNENETAEHGR